MNQQDERYGHADDGQQRSARRDVSQGKHRRGIAHHDAGILQPDESDKQPDAHRSGILQRFRDGIDYHGAQIAHREQDEQNAFDKHRRQRKLPAVAHVQTDGVGKEGVQPHTRRLGKRQLGPYRHDDRSQNGCQGRGGEHRFAIHARRAEYLRVDSQNVGHGKKRSDARKDFRLDGMHLGVEAEECGQYFHNVCKKSCKGNVFLF